VVFQVQKQCDLWWRFWTQDVWLWSNIRKRASREGRLLKTEESLTMRLLACYEFHFSQLRAVWKTIWTRLTGAEVNFWLSKCHSTTPLLTTLSVVCFIFPKHQMPLTGKWFTDTKMIPTKPTDALAEFQTVHFIKCSNQWHDGWTCYMKPHGDYIEGDNTD
jgi:hypothetical protein